MTETFQGSNWPLVELMLLQRISTVATLSLPVCCKNLYVWNMGRIRTWRNLTPKKVHHLDLVSGLLLALCSPQSRRSQIISHPASVTPIMNQITSANQNKPRHVTHMLWMCMYETMTLDFLTFNIDLLWTKFRGFLAAVPRVSTGKKWHAAPLQARYTVLIIHPRRESFQLSSCAHGMFCHL